MKKTLVVLLALVMVFAFAATAMAADTQYVPYGDIANEDADTQTAIERLSILGALKGYNAEGTIYAPANLITREEFATIGVRIAGLEDQVTLYASLASAFKDVEEGRWSEGYINCANANGIMIGRGAGLFDPKANVTMQEVVTVLLRAVGYTDQLPGAWPTDYNRKAVGIGLTEYVDFIGPKFATRGEVAALVNEAVDLYIVYYVDNEIAQGIGQIGWGPMGTMVDEDGFAYRVVKTNERLHFVTDDFVTLLNETFECALDEEVVFNDAANVFSEGAAWGFVDYEDWELEAYSHSYWYDSQDDEWDWDAYTDEFATLYGISNGMDLTDLGYQVASVTYNDDWEIVYVDINSEITRTAEADKDYDETWADDSGDLLEDQYGEVWYYDWSDRGTRDLSNYYAAKNFSVFDNTLFGIVDSVDADDVIFKDEPAVSDIDLDDDVVFYLMGTGFIKAEDLAEGDVVYGMTLATDEEFYMAFRPAEGALDDYGDDFIEVDDVEYGAINDRSFYSIDSGETVVEYDGDALDNDFSTTISWAPAYAFVNFAYFIDDLQNYKYGIIDSYTTKGGQAVGVGTDSITGVDILLPGEDEVTNFKLDGKIVAADFDNLPAEGSLIELTLNSDGEILLNDDEDALLNDKGHDFVEPGVLDCDDIHGAATGEWNSAKSKLELTIAGDTDVYTFSENAVIFVVTSDDDGDGDGIYYDGAESMTLDEFKAEGDFDALDLCVYKASNEKISVLYVRDMDSTGDLAYGIGLFTAKAGDTTKNSTTNKYYAYIGGEKIQVVKGVYDALRAGEAGYVAYKTTAGVIKAGDYFLFNLDTTQNYLTVAGTGYIHSNIYDELEYEVAVGTLDTDADWTGNRLEVSATIATVTVPATLTLDIDSGTLGSYDLRTDKAAKYSSHDWFDLGDDPQACPVLVIYDGSDDVVYYLVNTIDNDEI